MALQQTVTVTEQVKIVPKLAKKLTQELQTYLKLKTQADAIKEQMEQTKTRLGAIRDELGVESLEHDGFKVTLVAGTHKKFNEKKFIALGGNLAIYNEANEIKPSKPFEKISCPNSDA